eukprot:jgi/Mesvir1/27990/Mv20189-RA.1
MSRSFVASDAVRLNIGRRRSSARNATLVAVSAQQQENGESPAPEGSKKGLLQQPSFYAVVALAIFDAGLVDAGFSGDWSRIGAISKETEVLLQQSCAVVVPVSIAIMAFWWKGRQQGGAKD